MRKQQKLPYTAQMTRDYNRDGFLACLFIPQPVRDKVFALYAFEGELWHVREMATEMLIRQVRYAWWEEALREMAAGNSAKEHPVLQALADAQVPIAPLVQLVIAHREMEEETPSASRVDDLAADIIRQQAPKAERGWNRARKLITRHRQRFGSRRNLWLGCKLLWAGT